MKSIVLLTPCNLLRTVINFSVFDYKLEYKCNCYVIKNVRYVLVYDRVFLPWIRIKYTILPRAQLVTLLLEHTVRFR